MRARLRLALAMLATLAVSQAAAEPVGNYFYVAPMGGFAVFDGNLRFPYYPVRDQLYAGLRGGYQYRPWLGFEAAAGWSPTSEDVVNGRDVTFTHGSIDVVYSPKTGLLGNPYLLAGFGLGKLSTSDESGFADPSLANDSHSNFEVGGGINIWVTDQYAVRFEGRDLIGTDDAINNRTHTIVLGVGLQWAIGAKGRDTDVDGVPDRKDISPNTPHGATVNAQGVPMDSDGDGIFDGIDQSPNTPKGAVVAASGVPLDADGDGVYDGLDQCADTPKGATVDAKGCPSDADKDSVDDGIDKCPDTPTGAIVDATGCPKDADQDGVADGIDKCPDTPAGFKVDATGCPTELIERENELFDTGMMRLDKVPFDSPALPPEAGPKLDVIAMVLSQYPDLKIEIGGHTNTQKKKADNQKLSQARAQGALDYMVQKNAGLRPDRFTVKGYGDTKPLVPGNSAASLARNQRLEFKVLNLDALKKAIEDRKAPKKE